MSATRPIWIDRSAEAPALAPLESDAGTDVLVIGAGIAGLSVALALLENGRDVLLLDKHAVGAGQTSRSSAHLADALDDRFYRLERWHGGDGARLAAQSHAEAIDRIERRVAEFGIDCDFARVDGGLVGATHDDAAELHRELDAARRAGLDVEWLEGGLPGLEAFGPALRFPRQARVDPLRYVAGLAAAVRARGARFARAEVVEVDSAHAPFARTADGRRIDADAIVVATDVPFHESVAIHTKQAPYRTYVIAATVATDALPDVLLWDTADPYHYVRRVGAERGDGRVLALFGGADHKTGQTLHGDPFDALAAWTRAHFGEIAIERAWSGQILEPIDGLGFIGADPGGRDGVYVVTGDSGNGLTHGTLAGPLIAALIDGREHPWRELYDPRRRPLRALGTWLAENANVAAQYGDRLGPGRARPLARGDGAVVREGLHRIAVHRDADGALHAFSALCPHLGCAVRWNAIERSWDCPCHGSRFDARDGRVLDGPAAHGLTPLDVGGG
ncbi:MAG TPA: FAD-dependent oxidoreductase [Dokdonella sp.]